MHIPISALVSVALGQVALSAVLSSPYANIKAEVVHLDPVPGLVLHERGVETRGLEARQQTAGVFLCNDTFFTGSCFKANPVLFSCYNLPDGFWDNLSSIGPDQGFKCTLYDNNFCNPNQGQLEDIRFPGIRDLRDPGWNDRAASLGCFPG